MSYTKIDATAASSSLAELHRRITTEKSRVELTLDGSDQTCVIISQVELEGLERALELLSESDTYRAMASDLADIAAASRPTV